jgi:hypothetical protein
MLVIGRPINDTSINGLEFLLDGPDGEYMTFDTEQLALEFVRENVFPEATDEELKDYFTFMTPEEADQCQN